MRIRTALLLSVLLAAGCTAEVATTTAPAPPTAPVTTTATSSPTTAARSTTTASSTTSAPPTTATPASTTLPPSTTVTTASTTTVDTTGTTTAPTTADCVPGGGPCPAEAGAAYLASSVNGGVSGFVAVEVNGATIASLNGEHAFYPASSIKALQHLAAIEWVMSRTDPEAALDAPVPVSLDPCSAGGAGVAEPLREVLRAMMIDSDNLRANAVQDLLGLPAIADAAAAAGMDDTRVVHRFGCGGPANDPANRSTAADLARLFDGIGSGRLLDPAGRALFLSFLRRDVPATLGAAIEAAAAGLPDGTEFSAEVHGKAGWWGTDLSFAGLVTVPTSRCPDGSRRAYAVAAFVDGAASVAAGFDVAEVIGVVLEGEVRRAAAGVADSEDCP